MDQYKLKKVMKLTQRWIQDNTYKNHAETMKHQEWLQILTDLLIWKPDYLMISESGRLTDIGGLSSDSCSSRSEINLADYDN